MDVGTYADHADAIRQKRALTEPSVDFALMTTRREGWESPGIGMMYEQTESLHFDSPRENKSLLLDGQAAARSRNTVEFGYLPPPPAPPPPPPAPPEFVSEPQRILLPETVQFDRVYYSAGTEMSEQVVRSGVVPSAIPPSPRPAAIASVALNRSPIAFRNIAGSRDPGERRSGLVDRLETREESLFEDLEMLYHDVDADGLTDAFELREIQYAADSTVDIEWDEFHGLSEMQVAQSLPAASRRRLETGGEWYKMNPPEMNQSTGTGDGIPDEYRGLVVKYFETLEKDKNDTGGIQAIPATSAPGAARRVMSDLTISEEDAKRIADAEGRREQERNEREAAAKQQVGRLVAHWTLHPTADNPFATFGLDCDTAGYDRTVALLRAGQGVDPATVRQEEFINSFDYGDEAPRDATFRIYAEGAKSPFRAGSHLLRVGVKARQLGRWEKRALTLTILLDTSGSMDSPERLPLAKKAITELAAKLGSDDRVQLLTASDKTRVESLATLPNLRARGATNLEDGIRAAFAAALAAHDPKRENVVVIISDGIANLGSDDANDLLKLGAEAKARGVRCSVIGVGRGSYNDALLEKLAGKGGGDYRFLGSEEDIGPAFVNDLKDSFNAVAKDVKIQIEWNPAVVTAQRSQGYDRRELTREQFRDDSVEAGVIGSGKGAVAVFELRLAEGAELGNWEIGKSGNGVLGTVRVRYKRVDTGEVEEIERVLRVSDVTAEFERARPRLRLAFAVAEFATVLRHMPEGARREALDKVRNVARGVAATEAETGKPEMRKFAEAVEAAR